MITLATPTESLVLPAPSQPYISYTHPAHRTQITESGIIRSLRIGEPQVRAKMRFRSLRRTEYIALSNFIRTALAYSSVGCTITGPTGLRHERMHYISGIETTQVKKGDIWEVVLDFRQSAAESIPLGRNMIENPNMNIGTDEQVDGWTFGTTPTSMQNVAISESFSDAAIEIKDADPSVEWWVSSRIPIEDLRYEVSCRAIRTAGNRQSHVALNFYDSDGNQVWHPNGGARTGWWRVSGINYYFGVILPGDASDTWVRWAIAFGTGSPTYVPPTATEFIVGTAIEVGLGSATFRYSDYSAIASV